MTLLKLMGMIKIGGNSFQFLSHTFKSIKKYSFKLSGFILMPFETASPQANLVFMFSPFYLVK